MATIKTSLMLHDGMTGVVQKMYRAVNILVDSFEEVQRTSAKAIDTSNLEEARRLAAGSATEFDKMADNIREADHAQEDFGNDTRSAAGAAELLGGKLKAVLATVLSIAGAKATWGWLKESLELSDVQRNAENQLKAVLMNVGATEDAYKSLLKTASDIQKRGIYGDEAMIGGAAEFATYLTDPKAIESMMGTLADYAMGMSGGGEVDYNQMVDYATQLGKALNGSYDGLKKKGFELSDAQKEIIENGTDMQKALVLDEVIGESWQNLYEKMSDTPEGQIIQLRNAFGDLRETVGDRVYPAISQLVQVFTDNFATIERVVNVFATALTVIITILGYLMKGVMAVANFITEHWGVIPQVLYGIAGAINVVIQFVWNLIKVIGATLIGTITTLGAVASNIFMGIANVVTALGNVVGAVANNIATFFQNAFYKAEAAGYRFVSNVASKLLSLVNMINKVLGVFGIEVSTAGLENAVNNYAAKADRADSKTNAYQSIGDAWKQGMKSHDYVNIGDALSNAVTWKSFEKGWSTAAYKAGNEWAQNAVSTIASKIPGAYTDNMEWTAGSGANSLGNKLDGIANNTGGIADNTAATAQALELSNEELKLLREIAERQAINQFTTAEIKVEMTNNNTIASDVDLDGLTNQLVDKLEEEMENAAEGVHT